MSANCDLPQCFFEGGVRTQNDGPVPGSREDVRKGCGCVGGGGCDGRAGKLKHGGGLEITAGVVFVARTAIVIVMGR